jgi:hypothetical protein
MLDVMNNCVNIIDRKIKCVLCTLELYKMYCKYEAVTDQMIPHVVNRIMCWR